MPIYEYTCKKCGHSFEHLARTLADVAKKCPKCGAPNPVKQFSTFSTSAGPHGGTTCPTGTCPTGRCSLG